MMRASTILFILCYLIPFTVKAGGNIAYYNDVKFDDRFSKPLHFSGEFSYRDMDSGKVTLRETHVDGKKDGKYSKYNSMTGELEEEGTYKNDKLHGVMKRYQKGGMIQLEYSYENGKNVGVQKNYKDGIVSRIYLILDNGTLDTEFSFNKKGQLTQLQCGKNSMGREDTNWCGRNGVQSTVSLYSEEGKVRATEQYLWGKRNGLSQVFNINTGQVMHEKKYEDGVSLKDGQKNFNKSGVMLSKSDCDKSHKKCVETEYFPGGKETMRVTNWSMGKKTKELNFYQNGKTKEEIIIDDKVYHITGYYDTGVVQSKGNYLLAETWYWKTYLPDGLIESFSTDGNISRRENFKKGKLQDKSELFWKSEGHDVRMESNYNADIIETKKVFVDRILISESEYFPDGSIKFFKKHAESPLKD